jgi:flagellar biosynthesis protein FlhF
MNAPIRIKSFRGRNLSDALCKVRSELGPDAIILETKQQPKSRLPWSQTLVEVTASSSPPADSDASVHSQSFEEQTPMTSETMDGLTLDRLDDSPSNRVPSHPAYPANFIQVASELLLRDLPRDCVEDWLAMGREDLGPEVHDRWVLRAYLAQCLRREIPIDPPSQSWSKGRATIAIVGPAGHGKSSALAKIAGFAQIHRGLRPRIIACLHPSNPPHTRLAEYCELMGWIYEQVDAPKLASAVASGMESCDWTAIDLPSVPVGDTESMEQWRSMVAEIEISQTHLALSATTSVACAKRFLDWYQGLSPSHLLATHLDDGWGLGSWVSFLRSANLPLGFASLGPNVPDDIAECEPRLLAQWVLGA